MKNIFIIFALALIVSSCGNNEEVDIETDVSEEFLPDINYDDLLAEIEAIEDQLNTDMAPSEELLKDAISKYQDFAGYFPDDPNSPDYLLKASDFSLNTKQPEKAVKILNQIIESYPDYNRMEDVLFNKASHLDFELRDTTQAKATYQEFIDKYPDSELVDDAQSRIINIRFSMEEMVEQFMKNLEEQPQ